MRVGLFSDFLKFRLISGIFYPFKNSPKPFIIHLFLRREVAARSHGFVFPSPLENGAELFSGGGDQSVSDQGWK